MGMFDNVRCEYPLPGLDDPTSVPFQTKSFDEPYLDNYKITPEGRLLVERYTIEDRSDPKAEGLMRVCGMMTRIPTGWEDVNYHGWVSFYALRGDEFLEYAAKFTDGKLVAVHRHEETTLSLGVEVKP